MHGQPGAGKTFAVRVADELRDAFPDGTPYVDLKGYRSVADAGRRSPALSAPPPGRQRQLHRGHRRETFRAITRGAGTGHSFPRTTPAFGTAFSIPKWCRRWNYGTVASGKRAYQAGIPRGAGEGAMYENHCGVAGSGHDDVCSLVWTGLIHRRNWAVTDPAAAGVMACQASWRPCSFLLRPSAGTFIVRRTVRLDAAVTALRIRPSPPRPGCYRVVKPGRTGSSRENGHHPNQSRSPDRTTKPPVPLASGQRGVLVWVPKRGTGGQARGGRLTLLGS